MIIDKYISVLSSISSHILHQLFYNLLVKNIGDPSVPSDLKLQLIKICEKIISICQGDIVLSTQSLDLLLNLNSSSIEGVGQTGLQLWQNIRTKIFVNYSHKGMEEMISWLVAQFVFYSE